jgi:hypothetical protein
MPSTFVLDFASEYSFSVTLKSIQLFVKLFVTSFAKEQVDTIANYQNRCFILFSLKFLWKQEVKLGKFSGVPCGPELLVSLG